MESNKQQEILSTDIVKRGVEGAGPYAGSQSFSVKVRQGMPDFLSSVNLKYVKLGYTYLIANGFYLLMIPPFLALSVFLAGIMKLTWDADQEWHSPSSTESTDDITGTTITLIGTLGVIIYLYFNRLIPRSTYLIDFACFRPPNELKISKAEFIELVKNSGNFSETAIAFQHRVLKNSGIGDETYLPRSIFLSGKKITLKEGREEAAMVIFGAVDNLIAMTGLRLEDIRILVLNCSTLNTTPSLSAMVINHYKLRNDIQSFNLGGMGCSAGVVAVDLAKDLLKAYPGSYALVVSTEVVSFTWYSGNETDMLLPNCFFRMGASALLLSNCRFDRWRAKYELKQLVRTHKGMDDQSYRSIHKTEDSEGKVGISVSSKDLSEVGGHALKANITTLGSLMLPFSEQLKLFATLLRIKTKPYISNYKPAFEHICIQASSKEVLDELQKHLELSEEYMEAARKTLDRFGNTSSSSVWYELAYLEANAKIKRGDRIWQIAFGSGFKCNSVVWKALRSLSGQEKVHGKRILHRSCTTY